MVIEGQEIVDVWLDVGAWMTMAPHKLTFECLVPIWWGCLGRIRIVTGDKL